jgi:nucleoid-associated protein YgaU
MIYQAKYGVDLWLLAAWFYGNPSLWDVIYYENIEAIGDNPENITSGMLLSIPSLDLANKTYSVPIEAVAA